MAADLEIRHLRMIQAIHEEQSVTAAGKKLHLTQSALSHQLRDIEKRMGSPLFWRLNKRMVLTPAGERLLRTAVDVLRKLEDTEQELRALAGDVQGMLRFSTHCYTCYTWLPALMQRFHQRYSRVELRIEVEATRRPIDALLEGQIDLAISNVRRNDSRLLYTPIFEDEMVVVVSPDHPLRNRPFLRAEDFATESLILHNDPGESALYRSVLNPAGITPRNLSVVQLTEAIIELVRAGLGISVLASWIVREHVARGELAAIRLTRDGLLRQWHAITIGSRPAPEYVGAFISLLGEAPPAVRRKNPPAARQKKKSAGRAGRSK